MSAFPLIVFYAMDCILISNLGEHGNVVLGKTENDRFSATSTRLIIFFWARGAVAITLSDDDIFAITPQNGIVLGGMRTPGCNPIDGMAAIPEARLLAGIEITIWEGPSTERLHLFRPAHGNGTLFLEEVRAIDMDVPGTSVRGLAYVNDRLYVSEEDTESNYVYGFDLSSMNVTYEGSIFIGTRASGLATLDEDHLIAYDIASESL